MDPISDAFYAQQFRIDFLSKKGVAFQDWFARLAGHAFGSDYEAVRSFGSHGDWKCDGRQRSTGTVFQCYAPESSMSQRTTNRKIDADLAGAVSLWPEFIKAWVLVCNDQRGLPPAVAYHLDSKREQYPGLRIDVWMEPNLTELFSRMSLDAKRQMFGAAPTQNTARSVGFSDLEPVISALENRRPDPSFAALSPPSAQKLEKNRLSHEAVELLKFGRLKVRLVERYFENNVRVELGEGIAEAFRNRYAELRDLELSDDQIFTYLQQFAGVSGEPKRQAAAMGVLAYLFDRCDIFEDPDEGSADT